MTIASFPDDICLVCNWWLHPSKHMENESKWVCGLRGSCLFGGWWESIVLEGIQFYDCGFLVFKRLPHTCCHTIYYVLEGVNVEREHELCTQPGLGSNTSSVATVYMISFKLLYLAKPSLFHLENASIVREYYDAKHLNNETSCGWSDGPYIVQWKL